MYTIDYGKIVEYCKANWGEMCEKVIQIADDVCSRTFVFNMPWDMERTVEPTRFDGPIDWFLKKNGDNEYLFQMNRHRYFINLAQAYRLTGDDKYIVCLVDLMKDWISRIPCPYQTGNHPWRSLEVGLRGEYWTKAMSIAAGHPCIDADLLALYHNSLRDHGVMLMKHYDGHKKLSNWGVIQDHGLFAIGIELGEQTYIDTALDRLYAQANMQLMGDGVHWEQSCLYHNEVLSCFLDVIIRARRADIPLKSSFLNVVKKMADANIAWIKPNHRQPLFGDSDDTDIRDILTLTAVLFQDSHLKSLAFDKLDYESAWLLGEAGITAYDSIKSELPPFHSIALHDSGNYIMRSGWDTAANYLIMHNGYTGGGHAHEDKLSFDLSIAGKDVLTDCGRYTYVWGGERKLLKSYQAHNTLCVDGKHFVKAKNWGYRKLAPSIKQGMVLNQAFEMVCGTHLGYHKLLNGVIVTRKILWIKPDIYIIIDELAGKGFHRYVQFFNFAPSGTLKENNGIYIYEDGNTQTLLKSLTKGVKIKTNIGLYSAHYNQKEQISSLEAAFSSIGLTHGITVIIGNAAHKYKKVEISACPVTSLSSGRKMSRKSAEGIQIKLDDLEYTVILAFIETIQALSCNGKEAAGKITYYQGSEYHIVEW